LRQLKLIKKLRSGKLLSLGPLLVVLLLASIFFCLPFLFVSERPAVQKKTPRSLVKKPSLAGAKQNLIQLGEEFLDGKQPSEIPETLIGAVEELVGEGKD